MMTFISWFLIVAGAILVAAGVSGLVAAVVVGVIRAIGGGDR